MTGSSSEGAGLEVSTFRGGRGDFERVALIELDADLPSELLTCSSLICVGSVCARPRLEEASPCAEGWLDLPTSLSSDAVGAAATPLFVSPPIDSFRFGGFRFGALLGESF